MAKDEKPEATPPKAAPIRTVTAWAKALGEYHDAGGVPWLESHFSARHAAAATLHGWRDHAHHENGELELSESDYRAALDAASPKEGNPKAHKPALSKHCPHSAGH
jgi:hypothetical protein